MTKWLRGKAWQWLRVDEEVLGIERRLIERLKPIQLDVTLLAAEIALQKAPAIAAMRDRLVEEYLDPHLGKN